MNTQPTAKTQQFQKRLQGVGWCETIPASEVKVGMNLYRNFGYSYTVTAIRQEGKRLIFDIQSNNKGDKGTIYTEKRLPSTQIVAFWPNSDK